MNMKNVFVNNKYFLDREILQAYTGPVTIWGCKLLLSIRQPIPNHCTSYTLMKRSVLGEPPSHKSYLRIPSILKEASFLGQNAQWLTVYRL